MSAHLIDAAMVGQISYKHLAAAALASSIINVPFIVGVGITISLSQLISSARGKSNDKEIAHYLFNGIWICSIVALLLALSIHLAAGLLTHLDQEEEVVLLAIPYLRVLGWSLIPLLASLALKHFLDGLEMTRVSMFFSLLTLPVTVLADWLLIYGHWGLPKLELLGAAYGTLFSRLIVLIAISLFVVRSRQLAPYLRKCGEQRKLKLRTLKKFLALGIPISLQLGTEIGAFTLSAIIVGQLGSMYQAAHYIAFNCVTFTLMITLGLAQGSSIRVSHAWGQEDWLKINQIAKGTLILTAFYTVGIGFVFYALRNQIALLFNDNPEVIITASSLIVLGSFFQFFNALQVVLSSLLRGIQEVNAPTLYTIIAYWLVSIPTGYCLAFHYSMSIWGIWIGFIVGLVFLTFIMGHRLHSRVFQASNLLPV